MNDPSVRASDADRDQVVLALREHLLAGRLTLEEFSDRVDAALRARVTADLAVLQRDLPEVFVQPEGVRRRPSRFTTALLGRAIRRGRLRLGRRSVAASAFGDLDFDLRDATIDQQEATVRVLAAFGNVDVYLPEGVNVDVSGVTIFGHRRDWGHDSARPDAPVIHVRAAGFAATIDVWRVPRELRDSSYSEIFRALEDRRRPLPGGGPSQALDRDERRG